MQIKLYGVLGKGEPMSDKNFLSWVGFKADETKPASTENALERIRQLESQLADLRARRDITSLTQEEFEILATETAMTIIKSAQQRELKANALAEKVINDSTRTAKDTTEAAAAKASQILNSAESKGRKVIEAAEKEALALKNQAQSEVDELIASKRREAAGVTQNAKREADRMIADAIKEVGNYREWLTSAITEAERVYRVQTQSLQAAEQALAASRSKLGGAFEKLSELQIDISANVDEANRPLSNTFVKTAPAPIIKERDSAVIDPAVLPLVPHKVNVEKKTTRSRNASGTKSTAAKRATSKRK